MLRSTSFFALGLIAGLPLGVMLAGAALTIMDEDTYNDLLLHIYKNRSDVQEALKA